MKVIVAGFSKTGSKSMQAALHDLGYVVYDLLENFQFLHDEWMKILKEGGNTEDFRRMFENVDAVTDVPGFLFWEEIHKAFPDAKIVLTIRENEDAWAESFENQMITNLSHPVSHLRHFSPTLRKLWRFSVLIGYATFGMEPKSSLFGRPSVNMTLARMSYRRHNSHVLVTAPKDKLLVYSVKEGWEPLCEFLGVEVPDKSFPHKNVRGNIVEEWVAKEPVIIRAQREIFFSLTIVAAALGFGIYKFMKSSPSVWLKEIVNFSKTCIC